MHFLTRFLGRSSAASRPQSNGFTHSPVMDDEAIRDIIHPVDPVDSNKRYKLVWFYGKGHKHARYCFFRQQADGTWDYAAKVQPSQMANINRVRSLVTFVQVPGPQGYSFVESWTRKNGGGNGHAK